MWISIAKNGNNKKKYEPLGDVPGKRTSYAGPFEDCPRKVHGDLQGKRI